MPQQPCIGSFKDLATFWRAVNNASEAKGDGQTGGYAQRRIVNLQTVQQQKPLCREAERLLMEAEDAQPRIVNPQTVQQPKHVLGYKSGADLKCAESGEKVREVHQHEQDPTVPNFPECVGHCKHGVRCTNIRYIVRSL